MKSSARASSCSVVTPSRTSPRSICRVRPTSSPASRMRRSCSSVRPVSRLRPNTGLLVVLQGGPGWIGWSGAAREVGPARERVRSVLREQAGELVVRGERRGLLAVDRLALADDLLGVVDAALDLGALEQALDDGV